MAPCDAAVRRRVVLFPLPYLGHMIPMLRLAAALHAGGHAITVLHTELHAPDPACYPADYRFVAVAAPDLPAASEDIAAFLAALNASCGAAFKDRLAALLAEGGVRCVVTDVVWFSAQAAARDLGVPALALMTSSAASFRTFMAYPALLAKGHLPYDESRADAPVEELPPFRVRDLQRIDASSLDTFAGLLERFVDAARRSSGLIVNTFDAIEGPEVGDIRDGLSLPVFPVGPLNRFSPPPPQEGSSSCLDWLDNQSPGSVLFVSLGTVASVDAHELAELAWALAEAGRPFVWVVRPGMVRGRPSCPLELPGDLAEQIGDRGMVVPWAPQEKVLGHAAVGAFLTHSGWNSTVEALSEGVPMACLPCFGDQFGTARYACAVWKVGVEVGRLERGGVRAAIDRLMGPGIEGEEIRERARDLKGKVGRCVGEGGSSHMALLGLLERIASF
ncbi:DIMBOA UDP-glucosyltransferase BX8-like [Triticum dicoccoides]|uniref:DIMBOA UDP-glucosyltransferase BX8-like n=1 Tax=Triticum dicoccoides TaxID=85692 RepID=UPI0018918534|nr:DIMBOA UDP-glucosyltransferase BX8-like [Triticum dicoccoides]